MKTTPTKEQILEARRELKIRAARASLASFVLAMQSNYLMGWVHREICDKLDGFLQDVIARKSPRLIITMPPRSGKSEIVSRNFPAYAFGRNPNFQIIACSYSSDLSTRFNRDVQRIIDSNKYARVFPKTRLSDRSVRTAANGYIRTSDLFEIVSSKGSYRSTGVGGGITGQGADILIIDDPIKDRAEAGSQTIRTGIWDWFTSTAYTRLSPGGGVIVMATRWHMDDLIGRLISEELAGGEHYDLVNYPAIAEHDEPHRKTGEALHPERYPLEELLRIKRAVGSYDWEALYQQHPVPDTGAIFRQEWFREWSVSTLPETFQDMCISWDMAFKGTDSSDYVVGQVWGRRGADFYLIDQVRGRWDFVQSLEQVKALTKKYPRVWRKLVEEKANGAAIMSALKHDIPGFIPIKPTESKEARAFAVTPVWESGNVYLPPKDKAPWIGEYRAELQSFPAGAHDDQVDATTQALSFLMQGLAHTFNIRQ